ncbi:hypothetical protein [Streptomyces sp. MST-110588]|uniref:hypothetical protein n=1 Tax=Streptomyces sp. MST-110588 TaxID=2833628 RepID=UPI001F5CE250|nr:hypothetical protein [Streptomyces sp. MST-110588]UNO39825.1 hypothetical protein KGS77_09765 [Streptomyces sp. MST-110588]
MSVLTRGAATTVAAVGCVITALTPLTAAPATAAPTTAAPAPAGGADDAVVTRLLKGKPPCMGLPARVDAQSVLALIDVGIQDIGLLDEPEAERCPTGAPLKAAEQSFSRLLFRITGL